MLAPTRIMCYGRLSLLGVVALLSGACADPASQTPRSEAARDSAAVLSAALAAYAEKSGLDLARRIWLWERQPGLPISDDVMSALARLAPGMRRTPAGLELIRCPEGVVLMHPVNSCPLAENGIRIGFARMSIDGDVATVVVDYLYPSFSGTQEVHLVRGPSGTWAFRRFGVTIVS